LALDGPGTSTRHAVMWAGLFCFAVAWLALGLGAAQFRRPSYDRMLSWLVVAMPLAGYLWMAGGNGFKPVNYLHEPSFRTLLAPLLPLIFGVTVLITGIRRRTRAPLIAFMICMACFAFELRHLIGAPLEARLIVWGCIALVAAVILDRALRKPRSGITSAKLADDEGAMDLLELAGAAVIAPRAAPEHASGVEQGEGRFGGGGSSGRY
jgi:hypothetical protein